MMSQGGAGHGSRVICVCSRGRILTVSLSIPIAEERSRTVKKEEGNSVSVELEGIASTKTDD